MTRILFLILPSDLLMAMSCWARCASAELQLPWSPELQEPHDELITASVIDKNIKKIRFLKIIQFSVKRLYSNAGYLKSNEKRTADRWITLKRSFSGRKFHDSCPAVRLLWEQGKQKSRFRQTA
jgi:hypothetical protein